MKRFLLALLVVLMILTVLPSCMRDFDDDSDDVTNSGNSNIGNNTNANTNTDNSSSGSSYDYDMSDYITLPAYKEHAIEIELDSIQAAIDSYLMECSTEYTVTKGDNIIVDIVAYEVRYLTSSDGTLMDRKGDMIEEMSEENFVIRNIGSGSYARRVETSVIGSKVGATTSLKITLPDDFYVEEWREKEVFIDVKFKNMICELGDVVLADYTGYLLDEDGNRILNPNATSGENEYMIFDNANDAKFYLGSHLTIEGFEENIVGMKINDVKSFKATFPDDYSNEEVRGKTVEFELKLNSIYVPPIYDDNFVKEYFGYDTTAEFENNLKESYVLQSVFDYVAQETVVKEYPKREYYKLAAELEDNAAPFLEQYGISLDSYIEMYFGMTRDEYIKSNMKSEMIYCAISRTENIVPSTDQIQRELESLVSYYTDYYISSGIDSEEAKTQAESFVDSLGGEAYAEENVMFELVDQFLIDNANVAYKPNTYTSITITIAEANK